METTTARPEKRTKANKAVREDAGKSKCTLLMDPDTSRKLSVAASLRGMDRSEFVNTLLTDALSYIVISVQGCGEVSASGAACVEPVSAATDRLLSVQAGCRG